MVGPGAYKITDISPQLKYSFGKKFNSLLEKQRKFLPGPGYYETYKFNALGFSGQAKSFVGKKSEKITNSTSTNENVGPGKYDSIAKEKIKSIMFCY